MFKLALITWTIFLFSPFPTVAESIQKELDDYRSSEEEVKKLKSVMVKKNNLVSLAL